MIHRGTQTWLVSLGPTLAFANAGIILELVNCWGIEFPASLGDIIRGMRATCRFCLNSEHMSLHLRFGRKSVSVTNDPASLRGLPKSYMKMVSASENTVLWMEPSSQDKLLHSNVCNWNPTHCFWNPHLLVLRGIFICWSCSQEDVLIEN